MSKSAWDQVEAYAVLVEDKAGNVAVEQRHNEAGGSVRALQASQVVDTAIARLRAPPPSASDSASGYAPTARVGHLSEDLKKVVGRFGPGESALCDLWPQALHGTMHTSGAASPDSSTFPRR